jgi:hypothetical protein
VHPLDCLKKLDTLLAQLLKLQQQHLASAFMGATNAAIAGAERVPTCLKQAAIGATAAGAGQFAGQYAAEAVKALGCKGPQPVQHL